MEHERLENEGRQRDELDELDARDNHLGEAATEPDLPVIPAAADTASLGRTSAASDHWTPPPGAWLAPLSIDAGLPDALHNMAPDALPDALPDTASMNWPASAGWPPSLTLANQPTRRMRRRQADTDRPLFFALGALLGAVLVSGAALLAIVYIASHPGLFALASQRPPVVAPTATVRATATATATRTPTPSPTIPPVSANPLPIIVPQPTPTAPATPQATATPTPAPTSSPTAQPTATATPAATASPTPTAEPEPSTTPTSAPSPTPTPSPAATATPTATSP